MGRSEYCWWDHVCILCIHSCVLDELPAEYIPPGTRSGRQLSAAQVERLAQIRHKLYAFSARGSGSRAAMCGRAAVQPCSRAAVLCARRSALGP